MQPHPWRSAADARLEAPRQFTVKIVESRGWPTEGDVQRLLAAGNATQTVLDVALGTSLTVVSKYTSHVVQEPVDRAFQAHAWSTAP